MTNSAENFKNKLLAKEQAAQNRAEELEKIRQNMLLVQQKKIETYQQYLPELFKTLKQWSEVGGLKCCSIQVGYYDYEKLYQAEGLMVTDGNKKVFFNPQGVSSGASFQGTVQIEMPTPQGFHQLYFGLSTSKIAEQPTWLYVDYDSQNRQPLQPKRITEELFFDLMTKAFM